MEPLSDDPLDHTGQYDTELAERLLRGSGIREMLKAMDPTFDLIYVKPGATALIGGFFYIVKENENAPRQFWQVHDGDGGYCLPDSRHLDMMARNALENVDVKKVMAARREKEAQRKAAWKQTQSERFQATLLERLRHVYDASVAVPKAIPDA